MVSRKTKLKLRELEIWLRHTQEDFEYFHERVKNEIASKREK